MILVKEAEQLIFSENQDRVSYFSTQQKRVTETLATPLQRAMDRGELREIPADLLANMILVSIKGYQMRHCPRNLNNSDAVLELPTKDQAAFLTDLILFGAISEKYIGVDNQ